MKRKHIAIAAFVLIASPALAEGVDINDGDLAALDKDGDGAVSKSEFDTFSGFAFQTMDTNKDGSLSMDEIDNHLIGDAFKILDDNGDGTVSKEEFLNQMNEDFNAADENSDGVLN